jgi:hypothetical protein
MDRLRYSRYICYGCPGVEAKCRNCSMSIPRALRPLQLFPRPSGVFQSGCRHLSYRLVIRLIASACWIL